MSLPKTFKQAVFKELGGPLVIEEANLIPPGPGEILVKVEACGVCFSDTSARSNILGGGLYAFSLCPLARFNNEEIN
jgi:Zn-dependent alcohol dehydrogenase